ncbi:hypothetical protein H6F74_24865 [Trichocoleus sp. FACHB-90]|nr:hypothetical protein [Trichocoleus sp. FACHB-90]MBD1929449.1 hypothetical protein [Trichocoleus sp. FACHB-90]
MEESKTYGVKKVSLITRAEETYCDYAQVIGCKAVRVLGVGTRDIQKRAS